MMLFVGSWENLIDSKVPVVYGSCKEDGVTNYPIPLVPVLKTIFPFSRVTRYACSLVASSNCRE